MGEDRRGRVSYVIGPDGSPLTMADLPPPNTKRWVIRRKAEVVAAVRGGLLSLDEACRRYTLTVEEFLAWQRAIDRFWFAGPACDTRPTVQELTAYPRRARTSIRGREGVGARKSEIRKNSLILISAFQIPIFDIRLRKVRCIKANFTKDTAMFA